MFSIVQAAWLPVCAIAGWHAMTAPALAQTAPEAGVTASAAIAHPPVADPKAAVPAAPYRSPFTGYKAFAETPVASWRDTNELVRQRGGWRAYARESSEPASPPVLSPADAPVPALPASGSGHSGHRMK